MVDVTELIEVPDYVREVCNVWHDGQASLMYSVASTGKVQYQRIFQLLNDCPHGRDDPDADERHAIAIRNTRAWLNQFLDDNYFENLDQAMINEEEEFTLV